MKKRIFVILLALFLFFAPRALAQDYFCTLYFTYIGCPNCAQTDPLVLIEWPKKYPNLVVIEYLGRAGDWQSPNSQFFGQYAKVYKTQAAVPQIVIAKNNTRLGRIDLPKAENDIKKKEFNPCPLIDQSISFGGLDLNQLPAKPKIWANQRILIKKDNFWIFQWDGEKVDQKTVGDKDFSSKLAKELLFAKYPYQTLKGARFEIVEPQKVEFSGIAFPGSNFTPFVQFENAIKINILGEPALTPEQPALQSSASESPTEETIKLPIIGEIKTERLSLPILTFLLGLADGFNPCAFFVLTFLLAAIIGLAGARKKILLVGGIFIFFSALFYFLFMSVLLNVFQLGQKITLLTLTAGAVAVLAGLINIKDYFFFQKGVSLTLPKSHKEKFMARLKDLSLAKSTLALVTTTMVIAGTVNIYELLCTFGFPMVYVRILTLRKLPSLKYYLCLFFYNLIYIIPLAGVVLIFALTLGKKTFSQIWVRRLKLVSGLMILFLGLILTLSPKLLESASTAFGVMILAIIISGGTIILTDKKIK